MSLTPEETAPGGGFYQQCVQELQRPHPDYAKIQALATVSLVEALQEVARQVAEVSHQITLASRR
jgi:histone H3/H4